VLFHSPTCPHCRQVITEDLPIFFEVYGGAPQESRGGPHLTLISNGTLAILFVDASVPAGTALYDSSLVSHPVGADRRGVPRMIVGDSVMVGSVEIPQRLHAVVRAGLAGGGTDWPEIPGLAGALRALEPPQRAESAGPTMGATLPLPPTDTAGTGELTESAATAPRLEGLGTRPASTVGQRVRRDPIGNGLAIVGLGLMVLTLGAVGAGVPRRVGPRNPGLWLPLLAVLGAGVAAYLTYIETSGTAAVCGPVGDCNTVQQSPYARLFGVIPVGTLGLAGYGVVLVLWVLGQEGRRIAPLARRLLVGAALVGTVFSIYLTVLEPFVIGATCMWCLTSALVMTAVLWLAVAWNANADRGMQNAD
jgi:uncharacterized membrane protein